MTRERGDYRRGDETRQRESLCARATSSFHAHREIASTIVLENVTRIFFISKREQGIYGFVCVLRATVIRMIVKRTCSGEGRVTAKTGREIIIDDVIIRIIILSK